MKKSQPPISQSRTSDRNQPPEHSPAATTDRALMNYALRVLTRRAHTVFELRQKLEKRMGFSGPKSDRATSPTRYKSQSQPDPIIEKVLQRLQELHLLNDEDFTARAIENAARFKGYGPHKIQQKLTQKGIPTHAIRAAWNKSGISEEETAMTALKKQSRRWQGLSKKDRSIKQARFLASRGFSTGVIYKTIQSLESFTEDTNIE